MSKSWVCLLVSGWTVLSFRKSWELETPVACDSTAKTQELRQAAPHQRTPCRVSSIFTSTFS